MSCNDCCSNSSYELGLLKARIDGLPTGGSGTVTVKVKSTSTLPAGSMATVDNVGTDEDVLLDFGIPRGDVGDTPNIEIGIVSTLLPGSPATASMTGTPENPLLNLGIPEGKSSARCVYASFFGALLNDVNTPSLVASGARIPWKILNNNGQGLVIPAPDNSYFRFTKMGRYLCVFSLRCATKVSGDNTVVNWGIYAQSIAKTMVTSASAFVTPNMTNISGVGIFDVTDVAEQYNFVNNSMISINVQGATASQTFNDTFYQLNGVNQVDGLSCTFLRLGDL